MRDRYRLFIIGMSSFAWALLADSALAETRRGASRAIEEPPTRETTAAPAPPRADLAVTELSLSGATIDPRNSKVYVRVRNVGQRPADSTGLLVSCVIVVEPKRRLCPGSNPPVRFYVPALAVNAERRFEVPVRRFLLPSGQSGSYEITAKLDSRGRVVENNEYNNSRLLRFQR